MISTDTNHMLIDYVERLMMEKFVTEPFHNLYFIYKKKIEKLNCGGTCSDKTLSFYDNLNALGIKAYLHSAFIKNKEIHRLVSVELNNSIYYADIGNGWPSVKLFPKDYEIEYTAFGIRFMTKIKESCLEVYINRENKEYHSVDIPFQSKKNEEILKDIQNRFDDTITYPFSNGIRFSQIIDDSFLFLRDDTLFIYSNGQKVRKISGFEQKNLSETLKKYFHFDIEKILYK